MTLIFTTEMMASCQVGLLMIGQIFASSSELECPIARASHEVVDWAVTHCTAIHGCDSSSTVEWSKRVHTCQVEFVICGGVYGCVWWWHYPCVSWIEAPKLPPFHSQSVWQTGPFLETLCHGCWWWVSQWIPLLFLCRSLQKSWSMSCLRQARLPSGPRLPLFMVSGKCQPDKEKIVQTFLEVARFEPGWK